MDQQTRINASSLTLTLFHPTGMEIQFDVRSAKSGYPTGSTGYPCIYHIFFQIYVGTLAGLPRFYRLYLEIFAQL
jgi:hypothetical protein